VQGWATLGLNIRFKDYIYRQLLYTVGQGNGSAVQCCLWKFPHKKFVAESSRDNDGHLPLMGVRQILGERGRCPQVLLVPENYCLGYLTVTTVIASNVAAL